MDREKTASTDHLIICSSSKTLTMKKIFSERKIQACIKWEHGNKVPSCTKFICRQVSREFLSLTGRFEHYARLERQLQRTIHTSAVHSSFLSSNSRANISHWLLFWLSCWIYRKQTGTRVNSNLTPICIQENITCI